MSPEEIVAHLDERFRYDEIIAYTLNQLTRFAQQ